jgi:hypothetical protein
VQRGEQIANLEGHPSAAGEKETVQCQEEIVALLKTGSRQNHTASTFFGRN